MNARFLHETLPDTSTAADSRRALITTADQPVTHAEFAAAVATLAACLAARGIGHGERVGIYLPKHLLACVAPYAVSMRGAVFVPINPAMKSAQVAHIVADSGMRALLTSPERYAGLADVLGAAPALTDVLLTAPATHAASAEHTLTVCPSASAPAPVADGALHDDDLAALLYTSGSTGVPKGVMVTQRNLVVGCDSVCDYLAIGPDDRLLAALPFSFDYGFNQLTTALRSAACCVLHDYYLPRDLIAALLAHDITGLAGVPTMWNQLVHAWGTRAPYRGLRYFTNSGGVLREEVLQGLRRIFPCAQPYLMYGLTEAFRSTYLPPALVDSRRGSIGKAIPNAEILVFKDGQTRAAKGEIGELVHAGPLVTRGYWRAADATAERFRPIPGRYLPDGSPEIGVWSGDLVEADDDGFLYFRGRRDSLIKTSGYRVSPEEIEAVVARLPDVADCCVFAVPDAMIEQRVVLAVTFLPTANGDIEQLLAACRRALPQYMVPSAVIVHDLIPRNMNGKPDRPALAAAYLAATAAADSPGHA